MEFIVYKHNESDCIGICLRIDWMCMDMEKTCDILEEGIRTRRDAIKRAKVYADLYDLPFNDKVFIFEMPDALNMVAEFHKLFDHPILQEPTIPDPARCRLRYDLIHEELQELLSAMENKDIIGVADAFGDLQYVLAGAVLEFGLGDHFARIFNEVQRSNMSKACDTEYEAELTQEMYKTRDGVDSYRKERGGKWFVYRSADNKTLKSAKYSPVDIESIL